MMNWELQRRVAFARRRACMRLLRMTLWWLCGVAVAEELG